MYIYKICIYVYIYMYVYTYPSIYITSGSSSRSLSTSVCCEPCSHVFPATPCKRSFSLQSRVGGNTVTQRAPATVTVLPTIPCYHGNT